LEKPNVGVVPTVLLPQALDCVQPAAALMLSPAAGEIGKVKNNRNAPGAMERSNMDSSGRDVPRKASKEGPPEGGINRRRGRRGGRIMNF
jgi:hypothetical protein